MKNIKIQIYRDKKKEWRWKAIASNGRIIADCGEGYKRLGDLVKMLAKLFRPKFDGAVDKAEKAASLLKLTAGKRP